ncbi:oxidoreductase, 2OG-Fe(II) oxygenase family protein [Quillaja saponaria]|uniref:Oxidoreductase, 2OG-Fe(II) oxygenase family protein n=1 Tax=Quillaja saponaria TaxID=32244 RepID=A0AAD7LY51_QUISA|nr:oxidoreductase, 2OG-Fe(II) oxygenase family protein [Quillaja saponaria]KAJ7966332.1 oxidoreductase, 2OG-Fe(II) oxygenase family protein [Quillaja saponaria]
MNDHGSDDPFLMKYQPSELRIASEFLTTWLPFLSRDLCHMCTQTLADRIRSLDPEFHGDAQTEQSEENVNGSNVNNVESHEMSNNHDDNCDTNSLGSWKDGAEEISSSSVPGVSTSEIVSESVSVVTPSPRMSWADMAQEDELEEEEENESNKHSVNSNASLGEASIVKVLEKPKLPREQREYIRFMNVNRKKDFICFERVNGKHVNILEGLELHMGIISAAEQRRIVDLVVSLQEMGKRGELKDKTYSSPPKWMRGKGRGTLQFGCCYNYAMDKNGNAPGILQNVMVDPIPRLFKVIIRRLIQWHVLPPTCVPDSCIVNIYEEGDCIPPHIDNHDFVRPFCTVSFLSECNIVFGSNLKAVGAGEFAGSVAIPLPVGSVLVLNGNGADVAKHCVPAVPTKRISITFRKMDESKRPIGFVPEPDLQGIQPLAYEVDKAKRSNGPKSGHQAWRDSDRRGGRMEARVSRNGSDINLEPHDSTRTWQGPANRRQGRVNLRN